MQRYNDNILARSGGFVIPAAGASVTVKNYPAGTVATIYSDDGVTPKTNPIVTGNEGEFFFYAADGRYSLEISGGGYTGGNVVDITLDGLGDSDVDTLRTDLLAAGGVLLVGNAADKRDLASTASGKGGWLIGFIQAGVGAVARWVTDKLQDTVSAFDFMSEAQIADVRAGTALVDVTVALQAAIDACASATQYGGKRLYLPAGRYKISTTLTISLQFIHIYGDGMWQSQILINGVAGGGIKPSAMTYLRPVFKDFSVVGDAASGKGIDLSNITAQVYLGEMHNLYLQSGDDGFYAPRFFSMVMHNVSSYSYSGHSFRVQNGPGVTWTSCYALTCGLGKAGYRLGGGINMIGCNGVNSGDYWGVFGNDLTSADGFEGDFAANDLPDINLVGCNIEEFGSLSTAGEGIRVQNAWRSFNVIGGKIDRNNLATAYSALIHCRASSNGGTQPVNLSFGAVYLGAGVPSNAHLYSNGSGKFFDKNDSLFIAGVTSFKQTATIYPIMRQWVAGDIYGDNAHYFTAISPRRMTQQVVRYAELVPVVVGAGQFVDVTGFTKVSISPAAAASVSKFTFTTTPNAVFDYGRNGELIVEAGNGNLTLTHNFGAQFRMRMKLGVDLVMAQGDIARFIYSQNAAAGSPGWVQV